MGLRHNVRNNLKKGLHLEGRRVTMNNRLGVFLVATVAVAVSASASPALAAPRAKVTPISAYADPLPRLGCWSPCVALCHIAVQNGLYISVGQCAKSHVDTYIAT